MAAPFRLSCILKLARHTQTQPILDHLVAILESKQLIFFGFKLVALITATQYPKRFFCVHFLNQKKVCWLLKATQFFSWWPAGWWGGHKAGLEVTNEMYLSSTSVTMCVGHISQRHMVSAQKAHMTKSSQLKVGGRLRVWRHSFLMTHN